MHPRNSHIKPAHIRIAPQVSRALSLGLPVVALESTVISHGLPYPQNRDIAVEMEDVVRATGATPATIAVIRGKIQVGIGAEELEILTRGQELHKISLRDFAPALALQWSGGTTVAGTLYAAHRTGIRVFATGGIGGVHRNFDSDAPQDISTDLPALASYPVVVVCAGAKAILDLPATLEHLETWGVPVLGYQTEEFPAFYSRESGLPVSVRAESAEQVAEIARTHWSLGMNTALLLAVPPPEDAALSAEHVSVVISQALEDARRKGVHGQAVTPYLLGRVSELSGGESMRANMALLRNNARVAAEIAEVIAKHRMQKA